MTADLLLMRVNAPFGIRKDAQPPRKRGVRIMGLKGHFAQGFGGGKPSTSEPPGTRRHCLLHWVRHYTALRCTVTHASTTMREIGLRGRIIASMIEEEVR